MLIPIFELFYEKKNITRDVAPYVTSIEYTDVEHGESDELQITFEDSEKLWQGALDSNKRRLLACIYRLRGRKTFKLRHFRD